MSHGIDSIAEDVARNVLHRIGYVCADNTVGASQLSAGLFAAVAGYSAVENVALLSGILDRGRARDKGGDLFPSVEEETGYELCALAAVALEEEVFARGVRRRDREAFYRALVAVFVEWIYERVSGQDRDLLIGGHLAVLPNFEEIDQKVRYAISACGISGGGSC